MGNGEKCQKTLEAVLMRCLSYHMENSMFLMVESIFDIKFLKHITGDMKTLAGDSLLNLSRGM